MKKSELRKMIKQELLRQNSIGKVFYDKGVALSKIIYIKELDETLTVRVQMFPLTGYGGEDSNWGHISLYEVEVFRLKGKQLKQFLNERLPIYEKILRPKIIPIIYRQLKNMKVQEIVDWHESKGKKRYIYQGKYYHDDGLSYEELKEREKFIIHAIPDKY